MNRILVVLAGVTLPAVVAVIGCAVDSDRYPGIKNDIPNASNPMGTTTTSSSGTSTSSSTSSSGITGQVPNKCTCAAAFANMTDTPCKQCAQDTIDTTKGGTCITEQQACDNNDCSTAINCVFNCGPDSVCVANCIATNAAYQELLNCQCSDCIAACAVPTQADCNIGGTGGGGTGGAGPDAGDGG